MRSVRQHLGLVTVGFEWHVDRHGYRHRVILRRSKSDGKTVREVVHRVTPGAVFCYACLRDWTPADGSAPPTRCAVCHGVLALAHEEFRPGQ